MSGPVHTHPRPRLVVGRVIVVISVAGPSCVEEYVAAGRAAGKVEAEDEAKVVREV